MKLPKQVLIPNNILKEIKKDNNAISEWLSNTYGYCHFGFSIKEVNKKVFAYKIKWDTSY